MTKPPRMRLERHHDDAYWDLVTVDTAGAHLVVQVIPRYKTSGLSGDEWRVSARALLTARATGRTDAPLVDHLFGSMRSALQHAPYFIFQHGKAVLKNGPAELTALRKGHVLWKETFPTFGEAAMGMGWHITVANEQSERWAHLKDAQELELCQQPGCRERPVVFYRLKKIFACCSSSGKTQEPREFQGNHIWFCADHKERGDCGIVDCDSNCVEVPAPG